MHTQDITHSIEWTINLLYHATTFYSVKCKLFTKPDDISLVKSNQSGSSVLYVQPTIILHAQDFNATIFELIVRVRTTNLMTSTNFIHYNLIQLYKILWLIFSVWFFLCCLKPVNHFLHLFQEITLSLGQVGIIVPLKYGLFCYDII